MYIYIYWSPGPSKLEQHHLPATPGTKEIRTNMRIVTGMIDRGITQESPTRLVPHNLISVKY